MIGIYCIKNRLNNHVYIGQSVDIERRLSDHKFQLDVGSHTNDHLQSAWFKYGSENFESFVICIIPEIEDKVLLHYTLDLAEKIALDSFGGYESDNTYNERDAGANGEFSQEVKDKISAALKIAMLGSKNPMFGRKHTNETKEKIKQNRRSYVGNENPNFGKKASEETRKKISEALRGRKQSETEKQRRMEAMKKLHSDTKRMNEIHKKRIEHSKYPIQFREQLREEYKHCKSVKKVAENHNMNYEICRQIIKRYGKYFE